MRECLCVYKLLEHIHRGIFLCTHSCKTCRESRLCDYVWRVHVRENESLHSHLQMRHSVIWAVDGLGREGWAHKVKWLSLKKSLENRCRSAFLYSSCVWSFFCADVCVLYYADVCQKTRVGLPFNARRVLFKCGYSCFKAFSIFHVFRLWAWKLEQGKVVKREMCTRVWYSISCSFRAT